jgi:peptide/nickel transport system permease protein
MIIDRLPATLSLTLGAIAACIVLALPIALAAAAGRGRVLAGAAQVLTAAPVFWLGLLGVYLFSKSVGRVAIFDGPGTYAGLAVSPSRWLGSLALPWLVLAAGFVTWSAQSVRAGLACLSTSGYIVSARAIGLRRSRVIRHTLRAALPPVLAAFGRRLGALLSGALLIETVFDIPGIGRLAHDSVLTGDLPALQGTVLFAVLLAVVATLLVEGLHALVDPRASSA